MAVDQPDQTQPDQTQPDQTQPDQRGVLLAAAAWAGGLLGTGQVAWGAGLAGVTLVSLLVLSRGRGQRDEGPGDRRGVLLLVLAAAVLAGTVLTGAALRHHAEQQSPLRDWAERRVALSVDLRVVSDPRATPSGRWIVEVDLRRVRRPNLEVEVSGRAVLFGTEAWQHVRLGERWQTAGRLRVDDRGLVLEPSGTPHRLAAASASWRAAAVLRASIRSAAGWGPEPGRFLVPALVDGDDSGLPQEVRDDFRTAGMTHLLAVSGTNLTLVLAFVLGLARWCGVSGRWRIVVGVCAVGAFVLLARTEPSVLRAAVMGLVALAALGVASRRGGLGVLSAGVVVLLLVSPGMATEPGFALSVLATFGILRWAPGWSQALGNACRSSWPGASRGVPGWLLSWLPEALMVPLAAQIACTPVVAALSGQVSLVAVLANLVAAPAVGPVTVLGLVGGLVGLVWPWAGQVLTWPATWGGQWLVEVAERAAATPGAAVEVSTTPAALLLLAIGCAGLVWALPRLLRHPRLVALVAALGLAVVLVPLPTPGWPPPGWAVAACDVGQGDAVLLRVGPGTAVMVDAGPDPAAARRCLARFDVERVPLLLLTHYDADHVDGVPGILEALTPDRVETSQVAEPTAGVEVVRDAAASAGVVVAPATASTRTWGEVTLQVLAPVVAGTEPNDASVVAVAQVRGLTVLLTGDLGQEAQRRLRRQVGALRIDVLKVPHHGSKDTDLVWWRQAEVPFALVSVGEENTYGHPAPDLLDALQEAGTTVGRTDRDGDVAVCRTAQGWQVLRSG